MKQQLLSGESGADQQGREPEPGGKRSWFRKFLRIDKEQRYSYSVNISKKGGATMKK